MLKESREPISSIGCRLENVAMAHGGTFDGARAYFLWLKELYRISRP
jgi:hypothetical protein